MVLLRFCVPDVRWGSLRPQRFHGRFHDPRHHHPRVSSAGVLRTSGKARLATLRNELCTFRRRTGQFLCSAAVNEGRQYVEDMGADEEAVEDLPPASDNDVVEDWGADPAHQDWDGAVVAPRKKRGIIAAIVGVFVLIGGTLAAIQAITAYKANNAPASIPPPVATERHSSRNEHQGRKAVHVAVDDEDDVITAATADMRARSLPSPAELPGDIGILEETETDQGDIYSTNQKGAPRLGGLWDAAGNESEAVELDSAASDVQPASDDGDSAAAAFSDMLDDAESAEGGVAVDKATAPIFGAAANAAEAIESEAAEAIHASEADDNEVAAIKASTARALGATQEEVIKAVDAIQADTARAVEATQDKVAKAVGAMRAEAARAAEAVIALEGRSRADPMASAEVATQVEDAVEVEVPPQVSIEIPGAVTEEQVAAIALGKTMDDLRQRAMLAARASTVASEAARRAASYASASSKAAADAAAAAERGASATGAALAAMEIGTEEAIAEAERRVMKAAELAAEAEKRAAEAAGLASAHSDVADRQAEIAEQLSQLHKSRTTEMIDNIKSTAAAFWVETKTVAIEAATMLKQWVVSLAHALTNLFPSLGERIENGQKAVVTAFNEFWTAVGTFFSNLMTSIQNQWTSLGDFTQRMVAGLTEFSKNVVATIGAALGKSWESICSVYANIVAFFKGLVENFK